jgi:xanthine dehydrogenase YagS FAD-binding subunit
MKAFVNVNARDFQHAAGLLAEARGRGQTAVVAGGGSDLLGMMKERLVTPDVVVNLRTVRGADLVTPNGRQLAIGGLATLTALARHQEVRRAFTVLAEAAESVGTLQIRNVATIAGNVCQRPWCWYYRNGFPCFKRGGSACFSPGGQNQHHAILGGGPSFIVHPSDTAPALVALGARFRIVGPKGEREVAAEDFFTLPSRNPEVENALGPDEIVTGVIVPRPAATARSTYTKVLDREAWTHAVVSVAVVADLEGGVCRSARVALGGVAPVPWRVAEAEPLLAGQRLTRELADAVAAKAVADAWPLAHNAYKVPLAKTAISRTLLRLTGPAA